MGHKPDPPLPHHSDSITHTALQTEVLSPLRNIRKGQSKRNGLDQNSYGSINLIGQVAASFSTPKGVYTLDFPEKFSATDARQHIPKLLI